MMTRGRLKADRTRKRNQDNEDEERSTTLDELNMELLPEIPNDVTLQVIATMLPWSTFHTLSSVNRAWRQAVRSRQMYEARVCSHSTDTLVVMNHALRSRGIREGIALYSLQAKACYQLPPIRHVTSGIPKSCKCITLDGKIYLLGGLKNPTTQLGSEDVYMLDLAGQRQWKKCASMQAPRQNFGCGVLDGKIYVCGGSSRGAPVSGSEVYDPKVDAWTKIKPMASWRTGHEVGIVGDELLVYGGSLFHLNFRELQAAYGSRSSPEWTYTYPPDHVEVYNPTKDVWRTLSNDSGRHSDSDTLFMAEGKLHSMSNSAIFIHDLEKTSRTHLHSVSPRFPLFAPKTVLAVDDQLLISHRWLDSSNGCHISSGLLQGRWLRMKDEEIVWERTKCSLSFLGLATPFMHPLRL